MGGEERRPTCQSRGTAWSVRRARASFPDHRMQGTEWGAWEPAGRWHWHGWTDCWCDPTALSTDPCHHTASRTPAHMIHVVHIAFMFMLLGGSVVRALDSGPRGREFDSQRLRFRVTRSTQSSTLQGRSIEYRPAWLGLRWGAFTCVGRVIPYGRWRSVALRFHEDTSLSFFNSISSPTQFSSGQFSTIVCVRPILTASSYHERASSRHRPC